MPLLIQDFHKRSEVWQSTAWLCFELSYLTARGHDPARRSELKEAADWAFTLHELQQIRVIP